MCTNGEWANSCCKWIATGFIIQVWYSTSILKWLDLSESNAPAPARESCTINWLFFRKCKHNSYSHKQFILVNCYKYTFIARVITDSSFYSTVLTIYNNINSLNKPSFISGGNRKQLSTMTDKMCIWADTLCISNHSEKLKLLKSNNYLSD